MPLARCTLPPTRTRATPHPHTARSSSPRPRHELGNLDTREGTGGRLAGSLWDSYVGDTLVRGQSHALEGTHGPPSPPRDLRNSLEFVHSYERSSADAETPYRPDCYVHACSRHTGRQRAPEHALSCLPLPSSRPLCSHNDSPASLTIPAHRAFASMLCWTNRRRREEWTE